MEKCSKLVWLKKLLHVTWRPWLNTAEMQAASSWLLTSCDQGSQRLWHPKSFGFQMTNSPSRISFFNITSLYLITDGDIFDQVKVLAYVFQASTVFLLASVNISWYQPSSTQSLWSMCIRADPNDSIRDKWFPAKHFLLLEKLHFCDN